MSTSFFIFGFLQAATGYAAVIFYKQEHFEINEESYKSIGSDLSRFVVFFSRMGYVRKKALEEANRTGAAVYEIKSTEMTEGTLGFWWCGRFGMHRWEMPIKPVDVDLSAFDPCDRLLADMGVQSRRSRPGILPCGKRKDKRSRLHICSPHQRKIRKRRR